MMTMITEVFGVHGENGDLVIAPKLVQEQFDETGTASIGLCFADRKFRIVIHGGKEYGAYSVVSADCDGIAMELWDGRAVMPKAQVDALDESEHTITIHLN